MTVWALGLLLVSATVTALAFRTLEAGSASLVSFCDGVQEDIRLSERADEVQRRMIADRTPRADSLHDVVWEYIRSQNRAGVPISLEDISSNHERCPYTNLNTSPLAEVADLLFDHGVTRPTVIASIDTLRDSRHDGRASSLRRLALSLGGDFPRVRPFFTTEPMVNVNLASDRSLRFELNSRHPSRIARAVFAEIVSLRRRIEIDGNDLASLLSTIGTPAPVASALGVRTWTWRLTVSSGARRLVRILARIDGPLPPVFSRIGNRYERGDSGPDGHLPIGEDYEP